MPGDESLPTISAEALHLYQCKVTRMNHKKENRRKFLRGSIQAMMVTLALAATRTRGQSRDPAREIPDEVLPGDPGTQDTEAYGSLGEE